MTEWLIILISLWTYPIITYMIAKGTKKIIITKNKVLIYSIIIAIISVICYFAKVSTTLDFIDWILFTSIYFTICLFLWIVNLHSKTLLKITTGVIMLFVFGIGYFSSTIGALGVGFVLSSEVPKTVKKIDSNLIYKETVLGNAISDYRGKKIEVYKTFSWFPLFEWRIKVKNYYDIITYGEFLKTKYVKTTKILYLETSEPFEMDKKIIWKDSIKIE